MIVGLNLLRVMMSRKLELELEATHSTIRLLGKRRVVKLYEALVPDSF